MSTLPNRMGIAPRPDGLRAVFLDAMGTLVRLRPPVPLLTEALATAGHPNRPGRVAEALHDEIVFYRAHSVQASTPELLRTLRDECARVLADGLEDAPPRDVLVDLLVGAIQIEPFPDVMPFLAHVRARGLRAVVVSDWDCGLSDQLSRLGIRQWVDHVVVSADVGVTKPDPRIFHYALEMIRVAPGDVLLCGDDPRRDMAGAAAVGVRCVLVDREQRYPDVAQRVSSLAELMGWI